MAKHLFNLVLVLAGFLRCSPCCIHMFMYLPWNSAFLKLHFKNDLSISSIQGDSNALWYSWIWVCASSHFCYVLSCALSCPSLFSRLFLFACSPGIKAGHVVYVDMYPFCLEFTSVFQMDFKHLYLLKDKNSLVH